MGVTPGAHRIFIYGRTILPDRQCLPATMWRVTRRLCLLFALLLAPVPAVGNACEDAGYAAEQASGLPAGLLVAVGRVETGRRGADGRVAPWPWSVNAAGEGHYLASAAEAVALVRALRARGVQSIDVGCFQVNLLYHAAAFASLEDAFDPAGNARAAAAFLNSLRVAAAGLEDAVARYHSADPARGLPYMRQVMASWRGGPAMVAPPVSQVAALVRVFQPGGEALPLMIGAGPRLPVVIVPGRPRS